MDVQKHNLQYDVFFQTPNHVRHTIHDVDPKAVYLVDKVWYNYKYRGKNLGYDYSNFTNKCEVNKLIYYEHNLFYLEECLINLNKKGINLVINKKDFLINNLLNINLLKYIKIID